MVLSGDSIEAAQIFTPFRQKYRKNGVSGGVSYCGYDIAVKRGFTLHHGEYVLAVSEEHFEMPLDVVGVVHDKSTWARVGIQVQNTVIEPGWRGYLTLEISSLNKDPVTVLDGTPIAQVLFHILDEPSAGYTGKYQDAAAQPEKAKFE